MIGLLALQGDFQAHARALEGRGLRTREIRRPGELQGLTGLVLPGGESSVMMRLLRLEGLLDPLRRALADGVPTLATCAGLILLAETVRNPEQESLGLLPMTVDRNSYGRQVHSGVFTVEGRGVVPDHEGVFIRAPRISQWDQELEILGERDGDPVLVRRQALLAACYHPELSRDHPVIDLFFDSLGN